MRGNQLQRTNQYVKKTQPLYMVAASSEFPFFAALHDSGDIGAMQSMVAKSEAWVKDPANANDPHLAEERERIQQLKAEIARLQSNQAE